MNLKQAVKMSFKSIVTNKMRSILTMLGIIIGVGAVVIMVSIIQAGNKQSLAYLESMGNDTLNVRAWSWGMGDVSDEIYNYCAGLTDLVTAVTPQAQLSVWEGDTTIKYGTKVIDLNQQEDWEKYITIYLSNDQYALCNNYQLSRGRDLSYLDVKKGSAVCVLGAGAAEQLFDFVNPVDKTITLCGTPFRVIGVYEKKDISNWPEMDNIIVIPVYFNRTLNNNQQIDSYIVKASSSSATTELSTRLQGFLSGLIGENGNYSVQNPGEQASNIDEMLVMQSLIVGGIAGISLLVGGIGIMNIMLVTVTERTREIGIRKAIGAERRSIIVQFLIESAMICGMGGIVGILIGYLGTMIGTKLILHEVMYPSVGITVGASLFSVVLGIVFGIYPAAKASRLQPVEALRAD